MKQNAKKNQLFQINIFLKFLCNIAWPLEFSSYVYEAEFVNLEQDNVVKTFTEFGLEWEIQFTLTILNEITSGWHNIMYISGKLFFKEYCHFLVISEKWSSL